MRACSIIVLCIFLITSISLPASAAKGLSVAVAPARASAASSEEVARSVASLLSRTTSYHIIDRGIVRQVVAYHHGPSAPVGFVGAREHLARAQEHYFHLHYEDAAAEARRAVRVLERDSSSLHDKGRLLFDALMTQAMIARAMKDDELMGIALSRAAGLDPLRELDRALYPPSVVKLFGRSRAASAKRGVGALRVRTHPAVAEIYLNGIPCGITPATLNDLPAGDYALMIRTNKYAPVKKSVIVTAGKTKSVSAKLVWQRGKGKSVRRGEIDEALALADLLKADRAVLLSTEEKKDGSGEMRARLVDRTYRAAYRPIIARYDAARRDGVMEEFANEIAEQLRYDLASNPADLLDPEGNADPVLLGRNKRKLYRQPLFWGAVGTVVAGAIAGGVIAAIGGGGSSDDRGNVRVRFQ